MTDLSKDAPKRGKRMLPSNSLKRRIGNWKPRIYKRYRTLKEFIEPLGINAKRFTHWVHGRQFPPVHIYEKIEELLQELGV